MRPGCYNILRLDRFLDESSQPVDLDEAGVIVQVEGIQVLEDLLVGEVEFEEGRFGFSQDRRV